MAHYAGAACLLALLMLSGGSSQAASPDDTAVIAANQGFISLFRPRRGGHGQGLGAQPYVVWIPPNVKTPMRGWTEQVQPGFAKTVAALKHIGITPVDTTVYVNGTMAVVVGGETVDATSALKDGTLISAHPTLVTNVYEKDPKTGQWMLVVHHAQEPSQ